jgi:tripartite-type tricarboxylate transporter receptor subunit TctC
VAVSVALLLALASAEMAFAQPYPTRPITMIVPIPAGRATDTLAQFPAETMRPVLVNPS